MTFVYPERILEIMNDCDITSAKTPMDLYKIIDTPLRDIGVSVSLADFPECNEWFEGYPLFINGYFDPCSDEGIIVNLVCQEKHSDITEHIEFIKAELIAVLLHEDIHQVQEHSRDFVGQRSINKNEIKCSTVNADQDDIEYFGNPDEIEAYAFHAFFELKRNNAFNLREISNITLEQSPIITSYKENFKKDSKIMKKFLKKIFLYSEEYSEVFNELFHTK